MAGAHLFRQRVYIEDTDALGFVYYANYLKFAERARSEMLRALGCAHGDLIERSGLMLVVRNCQADFIRPARLEDELAVESTVLALGGASLRLGQVIKRGAEDICALRIAIACIDRAARPRRLPGDLRHAFAAFANETGET